MCESMEMRGLMPRPPARKMMWLIEDEGREREGGGNVKEPPTRICNGVCNNSGMGR